MAVPRDVRIDIWSDVACPWCFIGLTRLEHALAGFPHRDAVEVRLHSFQLDPGLPEQYDGTEAEYLAERKSMPAGRVAQMFARVSDVAAEEGLTLRFEDIAVANSRRAHRLLHEAMAADATGAIAWDLKKRLFAAHFTKGESISDPDVLVRLASEAHLDEASARASLESKARDDEVQADLARASQLGIQGVPFFVFADKYAISGAQPTAAFSQALETVWAEDHPEPETFTLVGSAAGGGEPACRIDGCD